MRQLIGTINSHRHLLAFSVAALAILVLPELALAQGGDALGVGNAFTSVSTNFVTPIMKGVRGVGIIACVVFAIYGFWKAIKEASGAEALKGVGLLFLALILFNPTIVTGLLGLSKLDTEMAKYGLSSF